MMEHFAATSSDPETAAKPMEGTAAPGVSGHQLPMDDPDNPMNWPVARKILVSTAAWLAAASVAFGITGYSVAIPEIMEEFDVKMPIAVLGMSLYIFGIFCAPLSTPHYSEKFGRQPVYMVSLFLSMLFLLASSQAKTWISLASFRFYAGFFGGPCLVLIEGTFADMWSADTANTYYAFLATSPNVGAALGPLILGFVVPATSWRWTQYLSLIFMFAAFLFGIGMRETYPRQIQRTRAKREGQPHNLPKAQSGETIAEMVRVTVIDPAKMLGTEPIVIMSALLLGANFGFLFQWFITLPVVLSSTYDFTVQEVGLAFISALVGAALALGTAVTLDMIFYRTSCAKPSTEGGPMLKIENRLYPAMIGAPLMAGSLFWIANTATPSIPSIVPIIGTAVYFWGSMSHVIGVVAYLFDAYPPRGVLSALTGVACFRIAMAGVIPLIVIQSFTQATPKWTLMAFGFVVLGLTPLTFVLRIFGRKLREKSRYSTAMM